MSALQFTYRVWQGLSLAALTMIVLVTGALAEHDPGLPLAQFEPIGFSENGRYLAYETFGLFGQDGLGSASVHVLDLVERRWVIGSPVTVAATRDGQSLADLRALAEERAGFLIKDLHITRPAVMAALNGDGEPQENGHLLKFGIPRPNGEPVSVPFTLEIAAYDVQAASPCEGVMEGSPRGFSLSIESFGQNSSVYADGPLPRSRGCPDHYRLMAVVVPFGAVDMSHAVALVSAQNVGPDGVQRNFVPVPLSMPGRGIN